MTLTLEHDDFVEADDDTKLANFLDLLPTPEAAPATIERVRRSMEIPFSIAEPNPNHNSFGVTWSSPNEDITRLANMAMTSIRRTLSELPATRDGQLPYMRAFFHQGGSFDPRGWMYWEMIGHTTELDYFVCEALSAWLPLRVAEMLDQGWGYDS